MEPQNERPLVTWSAPQRPYTVEFAPRTLDDIRLAVVDAFFSLPRGGTEIGGILLGCFQDGTLRILDSRPLSASTPWDLLSRYPGAITRGWRNFWRTPRAAPLNGGPSVGTTPTLAATSFSPKRTGKSTSDTFRKPWQTALVLRPHAMQPARAGFFFREADGSMRGEASNAELVLEALPVQPAPRAEPAIAAGRVPRPPADTQSGPPAITLAPEAVISLPEPQPEPPAGVVPVAPAAPLSRPEPSDERPHEQPIPIPKFLETPPESSSRRVVLTLAILVGCLAAAAAAFRPRTVWLPRVAALYRRSEPAPPPLFLGLNAIDLAGQLQIRWDRNSPAVRQAAAGTIEILDGATPHATALDSAHLQAGVFTYARQTEKVDVTLSARMPDGRLVREATSFLGRPPEPPPPEPRCAQGARGSRQADRQAEIGPESSNRAHQKPRESVADVQKQLKDQQARRMLDQDAGK